MADKWGLSYPLTNWNDPPSTPPKTNEWLAGKHTMNELMYVLLKMGDFPASHVSELRGVIGMKIAPSCH